MNFWVDTHCHLYSTEFDADRADVLSQCVDLGVNQIYMPNIDHTSIDQMLEMEYRYPQHCIPMIGLHPCYVKKDFERELYTVEEWLSKRRFAGIGEIGTDLYWDKTLWEQQKEAFTIQINWAKKWQLPAIIHCRESIDETISLLEPLTDKNLSGIFHCFSGNVEQARKIISMGFYLGIGGVATFKNGGLDKVLPDIDLNHLVLETDSPYLAPVPHRGKRNSPVYIPLIANRLADIKKLPMEVIQEITTRNALNLFQSKR